MLSVIKEKNMSNDGDWLDSLMDSSETIETIQPFLKLIQDQNAWFENTLQDIQNYRSTGKLFNEDTSKPEEPQRKRSALHDATQTTTLPVKTGKPSSFPPTEPKISIKKEKLDKLNTEEKENQQIEMPPPSMPVTKKGRQKKIKSEKEDLPKRSTRSRVTKTASTATLLEAPRFTDRPSDLILQKEDIPLVDLSDSDDQLSPKKTKKNKDQLSSASSTSSTASSTRPKRTKKGATVAKDESEKKRSLSESSPEKNSSKKTEERMKRTKRTKNNEDSTSNSKLELDKTTIISYKKDLNVTQIIGKKVPEKEIEQPHEGSFYEDARASLESNKPEIVDATFVVTKKPESPKIDELMTEDDSDDDYNPKKTKQKPMPAKSKLRHQETTSKIPKQVFSAYESSPVKKKVEAFERMAAETTSQHITRSKKIINTPSTNQNSKLSKTGTPLKSFVLSEKSASALKAAREEHKEREMRWKEKENEAMRLRKEQLEEKRRKREEKHIKAQQHREEEERRKLKLLEEQLMREEEKYKQTMAEKEDKLKKQKADAEKRRILAAKKAAEEKKREQMEEQKKLEEKKKFALLAKEFQQQQQPQQNNLPIYMCQKMPLLPTDDCYDSDDAEIETAKRYIRPNWFRSENLNRVLRNIKYSGAEMRNTFFCLAAQTPDLREIFQNIDPRKLKRTSSAVWHKPPRYTLLPRTNESFMDDSYYE